MITAIDRLSHLRVEQVMARDVVTVSVSDSMDEAAKLLKGYGVTGLPVVDHGGRCVGVLSAMDYVDCKVQEAAHANRVSAMLNRSGITNTLELDPNSVRANMSTKLQTIREHLPIVEAGRLMCQEHIHRLIVIDRQGRPIGIVSSLDLVSALVHAANL